MAGNAQAIFLPEYRQKNTPVLPCLKLDLLRHGGVDVGGDGFDEGGINGFVEVKDGEGFARGLVEWITHVLNVDVRVREAAADDGDHARAVSILEEQGITVWNPVEVIKLVDS